MSTRPDVILAGVACAFEPVDADGVDADLLCLDGVADARALVDDFDARCVQVGQVVDGIWRLRSRRTSLPTR